LRKIRSYLHCFGLGNQELDIVLLDLENMGIGGCRIGREPV
jgi:hypothetical protein